MLVLRNIVSSVRELMTLSLNLVPYATDVRDLFKAKLNQLTLKPVIRGPGNAPLLALLPARTPL